jgi:hypothetical protein
MQRLQVHQAFHKTRCIGDRWQMPAMQKYRV